MKKPWKKPLLIVLARGKPEENVLTTCKTISTSQPGASPCFVSNKERCKNNTDT